MIQTITTSAVPSSPHYAQGTLGSGRLLAVGGQNGVTADGKLLDGVAAQSEQAMTNVLAVLHAAGADQANVLRLGIQLVDGEDLTEASAAAMKMWGKQTTAITVSVVAGLARPGALVEIEALAVLP